MRRKSQNASEFINGLHEFVVGNRQFRKHTKTKTEKQIQTELRPLLLRYLENHFSRLGFKDAIAKAHKSFYWEGQEGSFGKVRDTTFGSRNYPDFIIQAPFKVAVEYKQSPNGSIVKHGIGQSMMHTLCGDFDFAYFLFHDESDGKRVERSISRKSEAEILQTMWQDFNVLIKFI